MPFVDRDESGAIVGAFAMRQRPDQEWTDEWPEAGPTVPLKVSRYQALAALMQAGLLDAVTAWAHDSATDPLHKLAFDTATEFARASSTMAAGAAALGWTDAQLDDLFIAAAQIQA